MRDAAPRLHVADAGDGPPVLLLHGQPGGSADWDRVVERLGAGFRTLAPDRPGYAESAEPVTTMAGNVDVMADLLARRVASPAVVVGHSYGGGLAALLAARYPSLVAGLVLVGSVGSAGSVNGLDHILALPALGEMLSVAGFLTLGRVLPKLRPLATLFPAEAAARWRAGLPDERYAAGISRMGRRMCQSFVFEQRSLLEEIDSVEQCLGSIRAPTTVMTGTLDVMVPPAAAASLAAKIPGARLVTLSRTGHFLPRDRPDVVASAVREVLSR